MHSITALSQHLPHNLHLLHTLKKSWVCFGKIPCWATRQKTALNTDDNNNLTCSSSSLFDQCSNVHNSHPLPVETTSGLSQCLWIAANQKAGQDQRSPDRPLRMAQFSGLGCSLLTNTREFPLATAFKWLIEYLRLQKLLFNKYNLTTKVELQWLDVLALTHQVNVSTGQQRHTTYIYS